MAFIVRYHSGIGLCAAEPFASRASPVANLMVANNDAPPQHAHLQFGAVD